MKNKVMLMVVAGLMSMCLAACGGDVHTGSNGTPSTNKNENHVNNEASKNEGTQTEEEKEEVKKEPGILKSETLIRKGVDYTDYYEYDKNGYMIKQVRTYNSGTVSTHIEWRYDDNGNLLEENKIIDFGGYPGHSGYEYDEHNNLIRQFYYNEDGTEGSTFREFIYVYDEHGNVISKTTVEKSSSKDKISSAYTTEITYDENGRKTFAVEKDKNGKKTREFEWSYDANGNVMQEITRRCSGNYYTSVVLTDYDEAGRKIKVKDGADIQEWQYDATGNLLSEKTYNDEEGKYEEYKYTYDEQGNVLTQQTISDREGKVYCTLQYEYNNGRLEKITFVRGNGYVGYWTTFEYDANDNVLKEMEQDEKGVFTEVEYTYYK